MYKFITLFLYANTLISSQDFEKKELPYLTFSEIKNGFFEELKKSKYKNLGFSIGTGVFTFGATRLLDKKYPIFQKYRAIIVSLFSLLPLSTQALAYYYYGKKSQFTKPLIFSQIHHDVLKKRQKKQEIEKLTQMIKERETKIKEPTQKIEAKNNSSRIKIETKDQRLNYNDPCLDNLESAKMDTFRDYDEYPPDYGIKNLEINNPYFYNSIGEGLYRITIPFEHEGFNYRINDSVLYNVKIERKKERLNRARMEDSRNYNEYSLDDTIENLQIDDSFLDNLKELIVSVLEQNQSKNKEKKTDEYAHKLIEKLILFLKNKQHNDSSIQEYINNFMLNMIDTPENHYRRHTKHNIIKFFIFPFVKNIGKEKATPVIQEFIEEQSNNEPFSKILLNNINQFFKNNFTPEESTAFSSSLEAITNSLNNLDKN